MSTDIEQDVDVLLKDGPTATSGPFVLSRAAINRQHAVALLQP
jgi:hypothetical protein